MLFKDEVRERRYIKKKHNTVTIGNSSPLIKKKKKYLRDTIEEKYGNKDVENDYICLN